MKKPPISCKTCGRESAERMPQGWYFLSVMDPVAISGRGYRYLGLFCSVACLSAHMPEMQHIEDEIRKRKW